MLYFFIIIKYRRIIWHFFMKWLKILGPDHISWPDHVLWTDSIYQFSHTIFYDQTIFYSFIMFHDRTMFPNRTIFYDRTRFHSFTIFYDRSMFHESWEDQISLPDQWKAILTNGSICLSVFGQFNNLEIFKYQLCMRLYSPNWEIH